MLVLAAERRNCGKQVNGVVNRKFDTKYSDFSINLHGLMGEYAVSKMLGVKIDTSVSLSGDDKISDLTLNGKTVQVKTRMGVFTNSYLFFRNIELFKADVAVLASICNATEVNILGWITREKFRQAARIVNLAGHDVVAVDSSKLDKPEYLKTYLETL